MGRSTKTKFALFTKPYGSQAFHTPMCWDVKGWGKANNASLEKWIAKYNESLQPGGCNAHIGPKDVIMSAQIRYNYAGGPVVATYSGPLFMVME